MPPGIGQKMNLVYSIAIGKVHQDLARYTQPSIKAYAEKIGAHYLLIEEGNPQRFFNPRWEKFRAYDLLHSYERVICFDNDLHIRADCPDLFKLVPVDQLGLWDSKEALMKSYDENEAIGNKNHPTLIFQKCFIKNFGFFYNTGIIVASRCHRDMFAHPYNYNDALLGLYDEFQINHYVNDHKLKVYDIGQRMHTIGAARAGFSAYDNYILHYAGVWKEAVKLGIRKDIKYHNERGDNLCLGEKEKVVQCTA